MAEQVVSKLKTIFDVRSKTFWSLMLAVVSIAVDAALELDGLPKIVLSVIQVILFLFAGFGLADAAQQAKEELLKKIKDFLGTSPAFGILIEALAHLSEKIPEMADIPSGVVWAAKIIGALLIVMGYRQLTVKARANFENRNQEMVEKYRHLLSH